MAVSVPMENAGNGMIHPESETTIKFETVVKQILSEIYDITIPFTQTNDPEICRKCPYVNLCGR
jgi:CRISPR/Cas system-associated exonuclease Cas4 (RecB family)